jgi:hypothetical protein
MLAIAIIEAVGHTRRAIRGAGPAEDTRTPDRCETSGRRAEQLPVPRTTYNLRTGAAHRPSGA